MILEFLDFVKMRAQGLFIVGDLFDFWFEYRHAVPNRHFAVLAKLHEIRKRGVEIDYLAGNHDMWLGSFLQHEVGLNIHHEAITRDLFGLKCHITHGDGTARDDVGYRILKRIMKHPVNVFLYRLLSPDIGVPFARRMSQTSRTLKDSGKHWDRQYREYAVSKLAEGFDVVVMGHTHRPKIESIDGKVLVNLGDWLQHFTFCEINERGPVLKNWPPKGQTFERRAS